MSELVSLRRDGMAFRPADRLSRELLAKTPDGTTILLEPRNPRNMSQHRAYFAMLGNVVEATGKWPSVESLSFDLSVALKRGDIEISPRSGKARWVPASRAVSAMPKAEFERLHRDTEALLIEWLGCHPDALRNAA